MKTQGQSTIYRLLAVLLLAVLLLAQMSGAAQAQPAGPRTEARAVTLPPGANVSLDIGPAAGPKSALPLQSTLAQIAAAYRAEDQAALATFSDRHIDLAAGTARVIIEMDVDPQAHKTGPNWFESVALPNGQLTTIEHAAPTAVRPDLAAAIAATGATFELAVDDLVQVLAPFSSLEALAKIEGVRYVRLPFPMQEQEVPQRLPASPSVGPAAPTVGTQTSEGVSLTGIGNWHTGGYDGSSVNLAVFDQGFTNWTARKNSGDLPSGTVTKDFSTAFDFTANSNQGTAGYDHGTACAEIAYDMAPASTVYLYAFGTDAEFANAVNDYKGTGISGKKVATMSIGWVNAGPYDGSGSSSAPATKVDEAAAASIFWANSAGNYQKQHYSGTSVRYSNTDYVAFGSGNVQGIGPDDGSQALWNISSGTVLRIFLAWNDWDAARTGNQNRVDYDLYLYRWTGSWTLVASSLGNQCSNAAVTPTEAIAYTVPSGGPYNYGIVITRYQSGCTNNFGHWMNLFTFNGFYSPGTGAVSSWWYGNQCNSITIPADATGAVATGATFWGEDGNATYDYGLETFSSFGPRNASGGANPGAAVNKPDVVAPDGVSTVLYPSNNKPYRDSTRTGFFGTSASAPHVAGMAASVWEKFPGYTLAQVRGLIQQAALYKGNGGTCGGSLAAAPAAPVSGVQNNRYGWGRINLSPLAVTLADFSAVQQGDHVLLTWETNSELNNRGFNLYRGVSPDGWDRRLNEHLIPSQSQGSPGGFVYTWEDDADLVPGTTYYYWVADLDLSGVETMHGPVSVDFGVPTAVTLGSVSASPAAGAALPWLWIVAGAGVALALGRRR